MTPRPTATELAALEARRRTDTLRSLSRRDTPATPADGAREALAARLDALLHGDHRHGGYAPNAAEWAMIVAALRAPEDARTEKEKTYEETKQVYRDMLAPVNAQTDRAAIEKVVRKWLQFGAEEMVDEILAAIQSSGGNDGQ